ncbi:hypothetical protein BJY00DRAFT_315499 [Aspergillus carlsbadensis]|nr:hypothetical protein BJY00DRAFT_315499 [Aspergillus carlsbadensis]
MPTATATLSWTITNWGPLTTSWSLPSACSNQAFIYSTDGPLGVYSPDPPLVGLYEECDNGLFTCYPEPTDSNAPSALSEARPTFSQGYRAAPVYSPAPSCPAGWKTVGALGRDGDGPVSRSGLFTVPYEADPEGGLPGPVFGYQDALASLLDPSETAVMCCPSSMTIRDNLRGGCRSTLEDYSISTACRTHFPANGMLQSEFQSSFSAGLLSWTTDKTTYPVSDVPSLAADAAVEPLVLFHQPTDLSGGSGDESEESEEGENPGETNAAAALRGGDGVSGVSGRMLLTAFGSMVAGAALVLLR